jgi:hypothetical protein
MSKSAAADWSASTSRRSDSRLPDGLDPVGVVGRSHAADVLGDPEPLPLVRRAREVGVVGPDERFVRKHRSFLPFRMGGRGVRNSADRPLRGLSCCRFVALCWRRLAYTTWPFSAGAEPGARQTENRGLHLDREAAVRHDGPRVRGSRRSCRSPIRSPRSSRRRRPTLSYVDVRPLEPEVEPCVEAPPMTLEEEIEAGDRLRGARGSAHGRSRRRASGVGRRARGDHAPEMRGAGAALARRLQERRRVRLRRRDRAAGASR